MKYKNITFILIIFLLLINPVAADSKVAPYAEIPTSLSANWPHNMTYSDAEFIQAANNDRIRQNGDISKIRFDVADASKLIEIYFTIWRKNESGGYDRIGITENLKGKISDGINEIELNEPISGVQEGDYYGYRIETSGDALYINTNEPRLTYYVHDSTSSIKNYEWESQDFRPYIFIIEPYMDDPYMIFIGDSIICGDLEHLSFLHDEEYTNIPSTIEYQWSNKVGEKTYQNMGHGGHKTTDIKERFNKDAIDLNPEFVLIEGGVNDINSHYPIIPVNTICNNWEDMIEIAHNNEITPVIMLVLPESYGSDEDLAKIDEINNNLIEIAARYTPSIVVDARSYVGVERSSGPDGNLWDINLDYDSGDGLHYNPAGNERIAQAIKDSFKYIYGKPGLYNLIQSDGTIIYSEGLSNAINTSWRMASTSGTANVIYNEPSTSEIANFTINSGRVKWFTIYNLSQDQVYNLRHSNRTLIESSTALNGIVNFTITGGLSTGTYYVDTSFVITDVNHDTPATDSVNITWETNKNSDSFVKYGTESGSYTVEVPDSSLVSSHSIELSGLNSNTTYYYVVNSTDESSNSAQSDEYFFTTADIADTTPPVISNITNTTPTTDSVTISWDTDENSDSLVKYGTESGNYTVEVPDPALVSFHSIELSGLISNTTYYYVVNCTDASTNSAQSDEYNFTTADIADIPPPILSQPEDQTIEQGSAYEITWMIDGTDPGQYLVLRNGTEVVIPTDYQCDGDIITIQVDTSTLDIWNYTIFANDTSGNTVNDQVNITIQDTTLPVIKTATANPTVIEANGTQCTILNVTATDTGSGIANVTVNLSAIGGFPVQVMTLNNGVWQFITHTKIIGTFKLPVNVTDNVALSNTSVSILLNAVDTVLPFINSPENQLIEQGIKGNITWTIIEAEPHMYWVLRNGIEIVPPAYYQSGVDITVLIEDTLSSDVWNYTIFANDTSGNTTSDQVNITVQDTTPPSITGPSNHLIEQNATGHIIWEIIDANPDAYRILRDGIQIEPTTLYQNGDTITADIFTTTRGIYNYTIIANDTLEHTASNQVIITVQETIPPVINHPPDQSIERCTTGNITWTITDATPEKYWVLRNGIQVISPTDFVSGSTINISIDNTSTVDVLNYTIFANDTSGNMTNSDQVNITVEENIPITISIVSPRDGCYTTSMSIVATGYVDGNGSVPTVTVNGVEAEINLTGFAGTYTATVPLKVGTNSITVTAYTMNEEISDLVKVIRKKVLISSPRSGGGGGGGASGEDFNNIMISETQREFVSKGEDVSYDFDSEGNIVGYINFTGYTTAGTVPAKVDILSHTSSLVNYAPLDIVYKNLNIWVGNKGWANSKNIANATISFNLEKSWITENNIDRSTIKMERYYNGKWNKLETTLIDQDAKYLYFESKIAGFSSFVITGKQRYTGEPGEEGIEDNKPVAVVTETLNNTSGETPTEDKTSIPGFGLFICLVVWLIVIWKIRK
ncbi:MAG: PGF-pre-PGF domain-containing protein, partial [Methanosarcinales archaeon]|nr:PGF-pre-PGF domain-containing protein [Methanosarcinales archaeon]